MSIYLTFRLPDYLSEELVELDSAEMQHVRDEQLIGISVGSFFDDDDLGVDYSCFTDTAFISPSRYVRRFFRNESIFGTDQSRRIPVIVFRDEASGIERYCFCFRDKLVLTDNSRYYREDWSDGSNWD